MERGMNISTGSKKGARSYIRLNTLRDKLLFFSKHFDKRFGIKRITEISEEQIHTFFTEMRNGDLKKQTDGGTYKSAAFFVKVFKAFWHWHIKVKKKEGIAIIDITVDLDTTTDKPKWVYLNEDQVKKLCDNAKLEYKVLIMFLFDTGIRSPTELVNLRVGDFYEDFKKLLIREETSKTFGRKINLMLSSKLIKDYVKEKGLKDTDQIFAIIPETVNKYLKRLGEKVLGDVSSLAGEKYSKLTMYDFRHSSACYWLSRYKSESALKYRFGWKKSEMIHYYTELLGMKDTITEEDLLVDVTKTEIEQRLTKTEKEKEILQEKMNAMQKDLQIVISTLQKLERAKEIDEIELRMHKRV